MNESKKIVFMEDGNRNENDIADDIEQWQVSVAKNAIRGTARTQLEAAIENKLKLRRAEQHRLEQES